MGHSCGGRWKGGHSAGVAASGWTQQASGRPSSKGPSLGALGVRGPDPTPTLPLSCGPRPTGNSLLTFRSRHSMGWSF